MSDKSQIKTDKNTRRKNQMQKMWKKSISSFEKEINSHNHVKNNLERGEKWIY